MAKKIGDKSCKSNFDKGSSDFGSFSLYLISTVVRNHKRYVKVESFFYLVQLASSKY